MRLSMYEDPQSIFLFRNPLRFLSRKGRHIGVYLAGGLLAMGWWIFLDAVVRSAKYNGTSHLGFEDWFSGILSTLGLIVINLIDKNRLESEAYTYSGTGLVMKARLFLFVGFSLIAAGFAGTFCVLIIKYIIALETAQPHINYGIAGVAQNGLIMLSTFTLWVAQTSNEEYEYRFRL